MATAAPPAVEVVPLTPRLALVAHQIAGAWLVSWAVDGRVVLGAEPYAIGSDEEN